MNVPLLVRSLLRVRSPAPFQLMVPVAVFSNVPVPPRMWLEPPVRLSVAWLRTVVLTVPEKLGSQVDW